jgi:hypothetical protein
VTFSQAGVNHDLDLLSQHDLAAGGSWEEASGNDYEHRKEWSEERLQELSACLALDVCGFAVMANHLHAVARTRPDLAADIHGGHSAAHKPSTVPLTPEATMAGLGWQNFLGV